MDMDIGLGILVLAQNGTDGKIYIVNINSKIIQGIINVYMPYKVRIRKWLIVVASKSDDNQYYITEYI